MYYVGLDLHSTKTQVCVINERDHQIVNKKYPNDLSTILKVLDPFKSDVSGVVVESTYNWYWLVDGILENGYNVHLANPAANKKYEKKKHTDDRDDAFLLSHLLRCGILEEGYIYPKEERSIRDLLRKRLFLVRQRTAHILSFQSLYNRHLGKSISGNEIKKLATESVEDFFEDKHVVLSAQANISMIKSFTQKIKEMEKVILDAMKLKPEFEKLQTVPGIGKTLALTISLETGNINRFRKVGNYVSYCRLVESTRKSNDKKKGENNRKSGNKYLCWAFIEAANFSKRFDPLAQIYFQKKSARSSNLVAIKALAHKIARACFYIMRDQVDYDPLKIFANMKKGVR
jgi:transposase